MMDKSSIDIESVVCEVIARLQSTNTTPKKEDVTSKNTPAVKDQLVVTSRVVTMAHIDGRLGGVRSVAVPTRAIVTPAVQDELLRRNVKLVYVEQSATDKNQAEKNQKRRLVLTNTEKAFDPTTLIEALRKNDIETQASSTDCLIVAVDGLASELAAEDTTAVLLTKHRAIALCLANRQSGVRAVDNIADANSIGANLLIVDPTDGAFFQMKQAVGSFYRSGPRACPAVFKGRLA